MRISTSRMQVCGRCGGVMDKAKTSIKTNTLKCPKCGSVNAAIWVLK